MMDIGDILAPDGVLSGVRCGGKKPLLALLAAQAAKLTGMKERAILAVLNDRERQDSTGIGGGVAVPHGRFAGLPRIAGVFAQLEVPVDYGAVDQQPVDLVFLLLSPEADQAEHLRALARIARQLRGQTFCNKLRRARSADALYALLTSTAGSKAA